MTELDGCAYETKTLVSPRAAYSGGDNHWLLSQADAERVRATFDGWPDLDPFGHPKQHVRARQIVLLPEDGFEVLAALCRDIDAGRRRPIRIYSNGEFGNARDAVRAVIGVAEAAARGCQVLAITPASPGAAYWRRHVWRRAAIGFPGRLAFGRPGGAPQKAARREHAALGYNLEVKRLASIWGGVWIPRRSRVLTSVGSKGTTGPVGPIRVKVKRRARSTFGERLRRAREEIGVGIRTLSEMTGIDRSCLSRWESGERPPRMQPEQILALATALDVDPWWLAWGYELEGELEEEPTAKARR